MSGLGKAILPNSSDNKIRQHGRSISELYSLVGRRSQAFTVSRPIGGTGNNTQEVVNRLNVRGGSMIGRLAFLGISQVTLVGANIDVSEQTGAYSSYIRLSPNLGGTCNFIIGAANDGDFLIVEGGSGYMFFGQSGNIILASNCPNPFVLQGNDLVTFVYDASRTKWVMQSVPPGSLFNVQFGTPDGSDPSILFKAAVEYPVLVKNSGSYTVDAQNGFGTDYCIVMNDSVFERNLTLPDATTCKGRVLVIKHGGSTFNVNVLAQGGQTIDGASSYVINSLYGGDVLLSTIMTSSFCYDNLNWIDLVYHFQSSIITNLFILV